MISMNPAKKNSHRQKGQQGQAKREAQNSTTPRRSFFNKLARHRYEILETVEAGLVLTGEQVKSIRTQQVNLRDAYAIFQNGECFILNLQIPIYAYANASDLSSGSSNRGIEGKSFKVKVLLHKREMIRLNSKRMEKKLTLPVLQLYFNKKGYVKISLGLAKGKKMSDQREDQKKRDAEKEMARVWKGNRTRPSIRK